MSNPVLVTSLVMCKSGHTQAAIFQVDIGKSSCLNWNKFSIAFVLLHSKIALVMHWVFTKIAALFKL